jgi:hypothetical protein
VFVSRTLLTVCALVVLTAPAEARQPTKREKTYARCLSQALRLRTRPAEAIGKGARLRGVRVRFRRLRVERYLCTTPKRAKAYAAKRRARTVGHRRVDVVGREVVVLVGARLADAKLAQRVLDTAWGCMLKPPSGREPTAWDRLKPKPKPKPKPNPWKKLEGGTAKLRRLAPKLKAQRPASPPPRASVRKRATQATRASAARRPDLEGEWYTHGLGVIKLSPRRAGSRSDRYEVSLVDFKSKDTFVARFDGRALEFRRVNRSGRMSSLPEDRVVYLLQRTGRGLRFLRVGKKSGVLPSGAAAFWNEDAEGAH